MKSSRETKLKIEVQAVEVEQDSEEVLDHEAETQVSEADPLLEVATKVVLSLVHLEDHLSLTDLKADMLPETKW